MLDELVVNDVASADDNDVVTVPVGGTILLKVINGQGLEIVGITLDRLAHHVVTVRVVVTVLNGGGLVLSAVVGMLGSDLTLRELELSSIKSGVGDAVAKHVNHLTDVGLEAGDGEVGHLTVVLAGNSGTATLNVVVKLGLGVFGGTAGEHLGQGIRDTSGGESVLARASTEVNTDGGGGCVALFSADTDAVGESGDLEGAVVLEGLGDLTLGKVAEVGDDGRLGELQVVLGLDELALIESLSFDKIIRAGSLVIAATEAPSGGHEGCWFLGAGGSSDHALGDL